MTMTEPGSAGRAGAIGAAQASQWLALALDVETLPAAVGLAGRLREWFAVAKVGLELFSAAGPSAVGALQELGYEVFLDLKLHDIPTTVGRAARVLGGLGVRYTTVHTAGGEAMVRAAVESMAAGAAGAGMPAPCVLGVTVLTSDAAVSAEVLTARAGLAAAAGCGGLVCAARDLPVTRDAAPGLTTVVPGIRPSGTAQDDQARAATPGEAIAGGADLLVVGRAVTGAGDPEAAAAALHREVGSALLVRPS